MSTQILTVLAVISSVEMELPLLKKPVPKPNCAQYTAQLTSLLNLMCENIVQNSGNLVRDACVGCFQRASTANNDQPSLTDLRDCAEMYLSNTRYEECSAQIDTDSGSGPCVTGYCGFVRCIRRVNSDQLIARCYNEASVDNDALYEADQITFVKNITSCILARTRCSPVNPISGQRQTSTVTTTTYNKWGKPTTSTFPVYNSLQITPEGDLRIIQLPGNTKVQNYFCTAQPNLRQSSWLEDSC